MFIERCADAPELCETLKDMLYGNFIQDMYDIGTYTTPVIYLLNIHEIMPIASHPGTDTSKRKQRTILYQYSYLTFLRIYCRRNDVWLRI